MLRGGYVRGSNDKERLQYPVNGDWKDWIQASLFGRQGLNETEAFYATGEKRPFRRANKNMAGAQGCRRDCGHCMADNLGDPGGKEHT
jgi:hypothetical protein